MPRSVSWGRAGPGRAGRPTQAFHLLVDRACGCGPHPTTTSFQAQGEFLALVTGSRLQLQTAKTEIVDALYGSASCAPRTATLLARATSRLHSCASAPARSQPTNSRTSSRQSRTTRLRLTGGATFRSPASPAESIPGRIHLAVPGRVQPARVHDRRPASLDPSFHRVSTERRDGRRANAGKMASAVPESRGHIAELVEEVEECGLLVFGSSQCTG
jgi:hypothetical protein